MNLKTPLTALATLILAVGITAQVQAADVYTVDTAHSTIGFQVSHLSVSTVQGQFNDYSGTVTLDSAKPETTNFEATIQVKSINTNNEKRDEHLRTGDFFDAAKFPTITFKSTAVKASGNTYTVTGDLTMKGVTKSITIPLTLSGPVKNPFGPGEVIGLSGTTKINRQDFGISFNKQMDQGGFVVGNDVTLSINLEAHK